MLSCSLHSLAYLLIFSLSFSFALYSGVVVDASSQYDSAAGVTILKSMTKHSSSFLLSFKDTSTNLQVVSLGFFVILRILVALVVLQCRPDFRGLRTMFAQ